MELTMAKPKHKATVKQAMKKDRAKKTSKRIKAAPIRPDKHDKLSEAEIKTGKPDTTMPHQKVASHQAPTIGKPRTVEATADEAVPKDSAEPIEVQPLWLLKEREAPELFETGSPKPPYPRQR